MARRYQSKPSVGAEPFELDGVQFTPGYLSMIDLTELARHSDLDAATPEGIAAIGGFFKDVLGEDYDRFRAHCRQHRTDPDTLMEIISDLVESMTQGFPTQPPSRSPAGPTSTGRTSRVISLSARTVTELPDLSEEQEAALLAEQEERERATG
jgi:hypothetical protein